MSGLLSEVSQTLSALILLLWEIGIIIGFPTLSDERTESERLNILPRVTQLVSSGARIWTRVGLSPQSTLFTLRQSLSGSFQKRRCSKTQRVLLGFDGTASLNQGNGFWSITYTLLSCGSPPRCPPPSRILKAVQFSHEFIKWRESKVSHRKDIWAAS